MRDWGGVGTRREIAELWNTNSWRESGGWGGGGGGGGRSDFGKGRRLPIPNITGAEWEDRSTRERKKETQLVGCS